MAARLRPIGSTPTAPPTPSAPPTSSSSSSSSYANTRFARPNNTAMATAVSAAVGGGGPGGPSRSAAAMAAPSHAGRGAPAQAPVAPGPIMGGSGALGTLAPGTLVRVGAYTCTIKRYLSQGGFAHVYLVSVPSPIPMPPPAKPTTLLVLKRMAVPDKEALVIVRNEVETHKQLRSHPYIAHFLEASASTIPPPAGSPANAPVGGYEIFILMEFCPGGGLIDLMNARLRNRLREAEILHIFAHVCEGVAHMHHQSPPLLHRDLKVENILLVPPPTAAGPPGTLASCASNAETISFKLCDFGSAMAIKSRSPPANMDAARALEADLNRHTTLQYRAPEMVDVYRRPPVAIGEPADIWALGVLLYKLCYYTTPFEENGGGPLAILNVRYRFPSQPAYSESMKNLIKSILVDRPESRPNIDQLRINVARLRNVAPPTDALKRNAVADARSDLQPDLSSDLQAAAARFPPLEEIGTGKASIASSSSSSTTSPVPSPASPPLPPLPARAPLRSTGAQTSASASSKAQPVAAGVSDDLISFRDETSANGSGRNNAGAGGVASAKAEMDKELRELEAQMDNKATMRRGRPTKGSANVVAPGTVSAALGAFGTIKSPTFPPPSPASKHFPAASASTSASTADKANLWTELERPSGPTSPPSAPSVQEKANLWSDLGKPATSFAEKRDIWTELDKPSAPPPPKKDIWAELDKPLTTSVAARKDLWTELSKPSPPSTVTSASASAPVSTPASAPAPTTAASTTAAAKASLWSDFETIGPVPSPSLSMPSNQASTRASPLFKATAVALPLVPDPPISPPEPGGAAKSSEVVEHILDAQDEPLPSRSLAPSGLGTAAAPNFAGASSAAAQSPLFVPKPPVSSSPIATSAPSFSTAANPSPSSALPSPTPASTASATLLAPIGIRPVSLSSASRGSSSPAGPSAASNAISSAPNGGIIRPKPMRSPAHRASTIGASSSSIASSGAAHLKPVANVGLVSPKAVVAGGYGIGGGIGAGRSGSAGPTSGLSAYGASLAATTTNGKGEDASSGLPDVASSPNASGGAGGGVAGSNTAGSSPAEEQPFRGVSNLIARWQAHAENPDAGTIARPAGPKGGAAAGGAAGASPGASNAEEAVRKPRLPGRDI